MLTEALAAQLSELDPGLDAQTEPLRGADAPDRIALHLRRLVQRALAVVPDDERVGAGIALARRVVALIDAEVARADVGEEAPRAPGLVLRALTATPRPGASSTRRPRACATAVATSGATSRACTRSSC